jgi:hypothetical protein
MRGFNELLVGFAPLTASLMTMNVSEMQVGTFYFLAYQ